MSLVEMWPVLGIEVRTPAVELFVPDQDTLDVLARLAAEGIYDPQNQYLPRTPVGGWEDVAPPEAERRFLRYFCAFADWRPERWNLLLAAKAGDDIVGVQEIGAQHFGVTRTVSTGSWIGRRYQGAGYKGRPGEPRSPPATAQPRPGRRVPSPEGRQTSSPRGLSRSRRLLITTLSERPESSADQGSITDLASKKRRVELRHIEIFLALAEELHFGRSAERLHVSQARVSQASAR